MKNIKVLIINGPNLNMLGKREPDLYGNITLKTLIKDLKKKYNNVKIDSFQTNSESEIITKIQKMSNYHALIINAAGLSHTSVSIRDSLKLLNILKINIHITDIYKREAFRQVDLLKEVVDNSIIGHGIQGYYMALDLVIKNLLKQPKP